MNSFTLRPIALLMIIFSIFSICFTANSQDNLINVPIGSIVIWPGPISTVPAGWLLCNGDEIPYSKYKELCNVLNTYWGPITGQNHDSYTLPDLRGVFLRGVNGPRTGEFIDPDANNRQASGKKPSNEVGSLQKGEVGFHKHRFLKTDASKSKYASGGSPGFDPNKKDGEPGDTQEDYDKAHNLGKETRPVNVYVNYIIRAN